jgi:hypothetical protein
MFYKMSEAHAAFERVQEKQYVRKTADALVRESAQFSETRTYDIFLSHSFSDAKDVIAVKSLIEEQGRSVYVDWIEDKQLDRNRVTVTTAELLRHRMKSCKSLVFATSENSSTSKWMPWELGYFDGMRPGKVSIFPLLREYDTNWTGQEYLGLYPVIEKFADTDQRQKAFVRLNSSTLQKLSQFGEDDYSTYSYKRY